MTRRDLIAWKARRTGQHHMGAFVFTLWCVSCAASAASTLIRRWSPAPRKPGLDTYVP
jgi:hypothetical protein